MWSSPFRAVRRGRKCYCDERRYIADVDAARGERASAKPLSSARSPRIPYVNAMAPPPGFRLERFDGDLE